MRREQIWSHGRLWTAMVVGIPAGLLFGLFQLGFSDSLKRALLAGLFFGVFFGAWMSVVIWSRWKATKHLSSEDRRMVARSVMKGEPIEDRRLAPAVIEYAEMIRLRNDQERRYRWTLWIWPALTLALAVVETANGSTRQAVLLWGLVVFWIAFMLTQPKRESKSISRASYAEASARESLDD